MLEREAEPGADADDKCEAGRHRAAAAVPQSRRRRAKPR
jgi:hypothetical protein